MSLQYHILAQPGFWDDAILAFLARNDHDFYPPIAQRRTLEDFRQSVYDRKGRFLLCTENNNIVGLSSIYLDHPDYIAYYLYTAIDSSHRGLGIANVFFNMQHDICRENKIQRAIVKTWSTNPVSQEMFRRHGFFHAYSYPDDRSKGVHTYFFVKTFANTLIKGRVNNLVVVSDRNGYAAGNFTKLLTGIPKTTLGIVNKLPLTLHHTDVENFQLKNESASHFIDISGTDKFANLEIQGMEKIDPFVIAVQLINERKVKPLVLGGSDRTKTIQLLADAGCHHFLMPEAADEELITMHRQIAIGEVNPEYWRQRVVALAAENNCDAVMAADPLWHGIFGFDKICNGIELFDPWTEAALLIQSNFLGIDKS